ncbi:DUF5615 family PIN-like protein [Microcoleus sp. F6_B4]
MKLLCDENLPPKLPRLLTDIFSDYLNVRDVGMRGASIGSFLS